MELNILSWEAMPRGLGTEGDVWEASLFLSHYLNLTGLPNSEDVGILKVQFPETITCIIMLCFIHVKHDVGKNSLGSEGHQTHVTKCCGGMLDLNWLIIGPVEELMLNDLPSHGGERKLTLIR